MVFPSNVYFINSAGMKSNKQEILYKLLDSFKYP